LVASIVSDHPVEAEGTGAIGNAWQSPPLQLPPRQLCPHVPQLFLSLLRSTQDPLHIVATELQGKWQVVPSHDGIVFAGAVARQLVQLVPHAFTSFGTQAPAHECVPPVHWHLAATQCCPPLQAAPHPPQLASSLLSSTQAPPHGE
jgi:hypothetical protein